MQQTKTRRVLHAQQEVTLLRVACPIEQLSAPEETSCGESWRSLQEKTLVSGRDRTGREISYVTDVLGGDVLSDVDLGVVHAPAPRIDQASGGGLPVLTIHSDSPGRSFAVVLSAAEGDRFATLGGVPLTVYEDAWYRDSLLANHLIGTTDAQGRAVVDLGTGATAREHLVGKRFVPPTSYTRG